MYSYTPTHSICFHEEIRKISILFSVEKSALSGAMVHWLHKLDIHLEHLGLLLATWTKISCGRVHYSWHSLFDNDIFLIFSLCFINFLLLGLRPYWLDHNMICGRAGVAIISISPWPVLFSSFLDFGQFLYTYKDNVLKKWRTIIWHCINFVLTYCR